MARRVRRMRGMPFSLKEGSLWVRVFRWSVFFVVGRNSVLDR